MAKTTTCPITQAIQAAAVTFVNADGACGTTAVTNPSNTKLLLTAGAEGTVVKSIIVNSDDSSARVFNLYVSYDAGTTKNLLCANNIPASSGVGGTTPTVDILGSIYTLGLPLDQSGRPVIELPATARLYCGVQVAVTASKTIVVLAQAEDY